MFSQYSDNIYLIKIKDYDSIKNSKKLNLPEMQMKSLIKLYNIYCDNFNDEIIFLNHIVFNRYDDNKIKNIDLLIKKHEILCGSDIACLTNNYHTMLADIYSYVFKESLYEKFNEKFNDKECNIM